LIDSTQIIIAGQYADLLEEAAEKGNKTFGLMQLSQDYYI
jgi:hypothetical protein